ncbi:MBL fold metallo-hydrolase [Pseudonocardia adelaidensis]|uniref:MBL fold metallo-hydrolase n=1 Tax=Pseudonocardia adelaidensis TaxID=648754 RepID=UPI0031E91D9E
MEIIDLAPDLRMLRFPTGQAYALREGRDVTLVDTGPPGSADRIAAALDGWGRVRRVVLTHYHADHAGSAREVGAWPGVEVAAHHTDARVVRGEAKGEWPDFTPAERGLYAVVGAGLPDPPDVPRARVDLDLDDGDVLDGLEVVWTPGHTPGSIALRHGERGVLFTGDTAAERDGAVFLGPFNIDRERAKESFRAWRSPASRPCASATVTRSRRPGRPAEGRRGRGGGAGPARVTGAHGPIATIRPC